MITTGHRARSPCHRDRVLMAEAREVDHTHARIARLDGTHFLRRAVVAAVVDEDELPRLPGGVQHLDHPAVEFVDIPRFVIDRRDDG